MAVRTTTKAESAVMVYLDGWDQYQIHDLTRDDLEAMAEMVRCAPLQKEIERILQVK